MAASVGRLPSILILPTDSPLLQNSISAKMGLAVHKVRFTASSRPCTGVVNDQFNRIHSLKKTGEADCVIKLIESYFADVDKIISELSCNLDIPQVDFDMLNSLVYEIESKSLSLGAELVKGACANLIKACQQKRKDNFEGALTWIKTEFSHTKNKLEPFVQMEKRIIRVMNSRT